jgi:subtilase family serine protease
VNRRPIVFLLTVVAMVSGANIVCQAEPQSLLTRHVREATLDGQAPVIGRLPVTQSMHIDLVLALRHQPELENFLQEVYDPSSSSYRHFVTVPEFTARFGPSQEDYDAVVHFAQANGLTVLGGSRDAMDVQVEGPAAVIEKAFHVTMGLYQHPTENRTFYAPDREPTLDLPFRLWHISGLDNYSIPRPALVRRDVQEQPQSVKGSCPNGSYCGSDMRAAYYGSGPLDGAGQTLGLLEYLGYDIADLNTYFKNVGQTNNVPVIGVSTDGSSLFCEGKEQCDTEQILDMTQSISMAPGMAGLYVYVGETDTAILGAMSTNSPLNAQLSASWT